MDIDPEVSFEDKISMLTGLSTSKTGELLDMILEHISLNVNDALREQNAQYAQRTDVPREVLEAFCTGYSKARADAQEAFRALAVERSETYSGALASITESR